MQTGLAKVAAGTFPTAIMVIAAMGCFVHCGWLCGYRVGMFITMLSLSSENSSMEKSWLLMRISFRNSYGSDRDGWLWHFSPAVEIALMIHVCGLLGVAYALLFEKRSLNKRQLQDIDEV